MEEPLDLLGEEDDDALRDNRWQRARESIRVDEEAIRNILFGTFGWVT